MAYASFSNMAKLLQYSKIHLETRIKFLNSFFLQQTHVLMPELEFNWGVNLKKLDVMYRNHLRGIIRGGLKFIRDNDGGVRYKLNNEKVHLMGCTSDVNNSIWK